MEKRVIVAIGLSIAFLLLYQAYFVPHPPPQQIDRTVTSGDIPSSFKPSEEETPEAYNTETGQMDTFLPGQENGEIPDETSISEEPAIPPPIERIIEIASRRFNIKISSVGARLIYWESINYSDTAGHRLQFIDDSPDVIYPGDIRIGDNREFDDVTFYIENEQDIINLDKENPKVSIVCRGTGSDGLEIQKTYTFYEDKILADLNVKLSNNSTKPAGGTLSVFLPVKILPNLEEHAKNNYVRSGPAVMIANKKEVPKLKKLVGRWVYPQPVQWVAVEENYFFAALIPQSAGLQGFVESVSFNEKSGRAESAVVGFQSDTGRLLPGENARAVFSLVLGPKKYDLLKDLNAGIENIISFGWINWLGLLFYRILLSTTGIVKNYGLSIIILTIAIKSILLPLSHISMKSMKKMQTIQPQMKEIQTRYRKEPQKMNEELQKLYRKNGVSPMAGCLPMLVQFPVFIALYQVLLNSIEMRGASFLWAHDLSQPDIPFVIIMGISMIVQQRMTPTTGDPRQAKMMMFMPILFTAMFWSFPSGLVLYWLVNNILTIAQQYFMNSRSKDDEDKEIRIKSRTLKKLGADGSSITTDPNQSSGPLSK